MTRVAAYYGRRSISTKSCPIDRTLCLEWGVSPCKYMSGWNGPVVPDKYGPVTVHCSAPTGKGKTK